MNSNDPLKSQFPSSASRVEKAETQQLKTEKDGKLKGRKVRKSSKDASASIPKAPPMPSKTKVQETHALPLEPFERQLQRAGSEMKLKSISKQLERTSVEAKKKYELPKMKTGSQNPLAKIGGPQFIPKQALSDKLAADNPLKYDEIINLINEKDLYKVDPIKDELKKAVTEFDKIKDNRDDAEALQKAAENLKMDLEQIVKYIQTDAWAKRSIQTYFPQTGNLLKKLIEELSLRLTPLSLEGVQTFYQKDEILNVLRINMEKAPEDQKEAKLKTLEKVKSSENQLIEMSALQKFGVADLSEFTPYVSSAEFVAAHNNLGKAVEFIQSVAEEQGLTDVEFVFKTGAENTREILAGKLIASLSLSKALVAKSEVTFAGASFDNKVNPEGITSQFLRSSHYETKKWGELMNAKKLAAEGEFLISTLKKEQKDLQGKIDLMNLGKTANQSQIDTLSNEKIQLDADRNKLSSNAISKKLNKSKIQAINNRLDAIRRRSQELQDGLDQIDPLIQKEQKRLNEIPAEITKYQQNIDACKKAKQALMDTEKLEGIEDHALTDILFCAYDQHIGQYMVKDGTVLNIDFARFMAQHEAFSRGSGSDPGIFLTFRSTFIDHPLAEQKLSDEKIQTIRSWDIKSIEAQWKQEGLIGDLKAFDDAQKKMEEIKKDERDLDKNDENALKIKCQKYGIKDGTKQEMQEGLKVELEKQYEAIKKQCYSQVHPLAFEAFKKRLLALQSYIADCEKNNIDPTLKGAFAEMYPLTAPFMKVLARLDCNPGESIGFSRSGGSIQQRSLNSIIKDAETKKLASPEEMQAMKDALAVYQKEAPSSSTLAVAMDLY